MKLKVLVIDDEECIRDTLRWYLEDLGHDVLCASEPNFCDIYQNHDCLKDLPCGDMLLIDYHMRTTTGLDFVELLSKRGCKILPANKIIISGDISAIDMDRVEALGCQVEQKPLSFERLDELIDEASQRIASDRVLADLTVNMDNQSV